MMSIPHFVLHGRMSKPHFVLHVGVNTLGELYWWVSRGFHQTLYYDDASEAVACARLVLKAPGLTTKFPSLL